MRHWLVVFMVLLLPLRGLVGEAMAGQMLQQHAAAAVAAPEHAGHHAAAPASPAHDCAGHQAQAQAEPAEAPAADAQAPGDCPTCASCQMCSSIALSPTVQAAGSMRASQPAPDTVQRAYPSAEPVLAFKPPRS